LLTSSQQWEEVRSVPGAARRLALLIAQSRQFLVALGRADVQPSIFDSFELRDSAVGKFPRALVAL
jgi:hypothetical protein